MAGGNTPTGGYPDSVRAAAFSFCNTATGREALVTAPALSILRELGFLGYSGPLPTPNPPTTSLADFMAVLGDHANHTLVPREVRLIHRTMALMRVAMGNVGLGG